MAGAVGLEPTTAGVTTRCTCLWRFTPKAGFLPWTRITGNLCLRDDRQPRPAYEASRIALGCLCATAVTAAWACTCTFITILHNRILLI